MVTPYFAKMPRGDGLREYGGQAVWGQWNGERFIYTLKKKTYKVASLVCEAFNGSRPEGMVCMHLDENAAHNVPTNLQWGTQKQNLNAPGFLAYCSTRTGENNPLVKGRKKKVYSNV